MNRLHPAITKRQKFWETVEIIWLEFLETLTFYSEGQVTVGKSTEAMDFVISLTTSPQELNRMTALAILRNITFFQGNRLRLLNRGKIFVSKAKITKRINLISLLTKSEGVSTELNSETNLASFE